MQKKLPYSVIVQSNDWLIAENVQAWPKRTSVLRKLHQSNVCISIKIDSCPSFAAFAVCRIRTCLQVDYAHTHACSEGENKQKNSVQSQHTCKMWNRTLQQLVFFSVEILQHRTFSMMAGWMIFAFEAARPRKCSMQIMAEIIFSLSSFLFQWLHPVVSQESE